VRAWIYGVAVAFVPLAVYLGWMTIEASPLVLALILAILNLNPDLEVYDILEDDADD
jgi:hypothetical protein